MPIGGGGGVIRRSCGAFCSAMPVLLSVSLLLLTYRCILHIAAARVEHVLDRNPDVQSLLGRLSSSSASATAAGGGGGGDPRRRRDHHHHGPGYSRRPRGRPPFLHLSRVGTLDDDFSDIDRATGDHNPYRRHSGWLFNSSTFLMMNTGHGGRRPWLPGDRKIRVSEPTAPPILFLMAEDDGGAGEVDTAAEDGEDEAAEIEIRIFGQGFHLERRDAVVLAYLMSLFSVVYFFATVGFLSLYSCAVGIVFLAVAEFLLGRRRSFVKTIYGGCCLGIRRALVFVFLRWVVRDVLAQFLCILFFSDVNDQQSVLKLFVRVKLMPFLLTASPITQWSGGDESSLWWFLLAWGLLERVVALVFAFSWWAAVTDHHQRRRGPEVLWEGFRQVLSMAERAFLLRQVEMMICWNSGRWVLTAIGGSLFADVVQSVAEVFFMVVWLLCYLDARSREAQHGGRRFGWRNLEDCIRGLG